MDNLLPNEAVEELSAEEQKAELFRLNKERVQFAKPVVKHIVSPHSGSILSKPEPKVPLESDMLEKFSHGFNSMAVDGYVKKQQIPELLNKCGFSHDIALLAKLVEEFYTSDESLDLSSFIAFVENFYAPDYYFGEILRKSVARGQNKEVTNLLLRNCNANTSDGEGTSSLHYCCEFNRPDVIEILAKIAKKGLAVNAQDRYGWTPLHTAAHQGNKNCVSLLIKLGANVNLVNTVGKSPLHIAVTQNRGAIVDLLLTAKADLNLRDKQGMTPLHEAAYRGQFTLYNELSQRPNADLTIRDVLGNLPSDAIISNNEMKCLFPIQIVNKSACVRCLQSFSFKLK